MLGKLASHVQTTWALSCLKVHSWDSEPSRGDLEAQHSLFPPLAREEGGQGMMHKWPLTFLPSRIGAVGCVGERSQGPGQARPPWQCTPSAKSYIKPIKGLSSLQSYSCLAARDGRLMLGPRDLD